MGRYRVAASAGAAPAGLVCQRDGRVGRPISGRHSTGVNLRRPVRFAECIICRRATHFIEGRPGSGLTGSIGSDRPAPAEGDGGVDAGRTGPSWPRLGLPVRWCAGAVVGGVRRLRVDGGYSCPHAFQRQRFWGDARYGWSLVRPGWVWARPSMPCWSAVVPAARLTSGADRRLSLADQPWPATWWKQGGAVPEAGFVGLVIRR